MDLFRRLAIVFVATFLFVSCDGGLSTSGSGGSGIGGTGITLVQGNVVSVNGQLFVHIKSDKTLNIANTLTEWAIPFSYAQTSGLTVSGGGQSTTVNSSGEFALPDVVPSANFVLTFTVDGNDNIPLAIGQVVEGAVVTVNNIAIDTNSGSAKPSNIDVEEPDEDDEVSADTTSDIDDQDSTDDPEDNSEDPEDSDDSIDDDSTDGM
jgi:hypothetical protein